MEAERGLQERAAELQKKSPKDLDHENLKPDDLTDEDLLLVIQGIHPKYSDCASQFALRPVLGS
jgi:hypothetical protein